jgi:hypothetical protein
LKFTTGTKSSYFAASTSMNVLVLPQMSGIFLHFAKMPGSVIHGLWWLDGDDNLFL